MFINYIVGLSAILDMVSWKLPKNPVWILFKLYIYLYFVPQVKEQYWQVRVGGATPKRDVLIP